MKTEIIQSLTGDFESHARQTENGVEFWLARDLQGLLGYTDWRNFLQVVDRAKVACEMSSHSVSDHFVDANKMVTLGSGSRREVADMMLTRYACAGGFCADHRAESQGLRRGNHHLQRQS